MRLWYILYSCDIYKNNAQQQWPSGVGAGLVMARLCIDPGSTLDLFVTIFFTFAFAFARNNHIL